MFSRIGYNELHDRVFRDDYSGYKPTVKEIPNGDGKVDAEKRYAHVAIKYFTTAEHRTYLGPYLELAHDRSLTVARALGIPAAYMPRIEYGALRVLEYPPGAVSNEHEDFDLFTLMCYRDQPERFVSSGPFTHQLDALHHLDPQGHIGQLGFEIGLGAATRHSVRTSTTPQHSIVYFSIPDHNAVLPSGVTVRDWLNERMARSRTEFKKYE